MTGLDRTIEEQLLGRGTRDVLAPADRSAFAGQRILITGAGGSVGRELARQLAACGPARLTLLDHCEYALVQAERSLRGDHPDLPLDAVLGDVSRRVDIVTACGTARPHVVFHAAACKHVPVAEAAVIQAARTNVLGTVEVARACRRVGARLVLISTDKAAQPASVMGATKRFAELVALDRAGLTFRPVVVRFGNILGSSGSVAEIMLRSIEEGRAIPITDPDATRFFMTASEAVALVLKADRMGRRRDVYWLDMGDPLRIGDLAARMLEHAASLGYARVPLTIIGMRPGEKMREELTTQGLAMQATAHPRIWRARQRAVSRPVLDAAVRALRTACATGDALRALEAVCAAVDDYTPSGAAVAAARVATLSSPGRSAGAATRLVAVGG